MRETVEIIERRVRGSSDVVYDIGHYILTYLIDLISDGVLHDLSHRSLFTAFVIIVNTKNLHLKFEIYIYIETYIILPSGLY